MKELYLTITLSLLIYWAGLLIEDFNCWRRAIKIMGGGQKRRSMARYL